MTTPTSGSTTQSFMDPAMVPYYSDFAATAQGLAKEPYQLYGGDRVADFTKEQDAAFAGISSLRTPGEYNQASGLFGQAGNFAANTLTAPGTLGGASFSAISGTAPQLGVASFSPTFQNYSGLGGASFSPTFQNYKELGGATFSPAFQNYEKLGGATFSPAFQNYEKLGGAAFTNAANLGFNSLAAQQYMSPYATGVLDVAARKMQEEGARNIALGGLKAAGLGGYGGSANAINAAAINRALTTGIGDLYSTGLGKAYENAQAQFNADRAARLGQEKTIEDARQAIYGTNLSAYERAAKLRLDQEQIAEKARQDIYGTNLGAYERAAKLRLDQETEAERARQSVYGTNLKAYEDAANIRLAQEQAAEKARQDIYGTNLGAYERAAKFRLDQERAAEEAERSRYAANIRAIQDQQKLRLDQEAEAERARQAVYGLNADKALEAFKANETARQYEAENQRKTAEGLLSLAAQRQTSDLGRLAALEQAGEFENSIAERDWQRNLLSWASNIINQLPAGQAEVRYNYDEPPSTVNQLAGLAGAFLSGSKLAGS